MQYIGKIDLNKIGEYSNKIVTYDVVLTEERNRYIYEAHNNDYEIIMKNIANTILKPQEILIDSNNEDTLFFIGRLAKNNLNVVIKLNTTNSEKHPKNSIMTAWIIRNKNLYKLRKRNKTICKNE